MALIGSMIAWLMKKRMHQIELFIRYPHDVQSEWFKRLIAGGRDTEWGRHYGYDSIRSPGEFRERVPVNDYDGLRPYIDRLRQGEQRVLWGSDIRWFAKSSGTTSDKSKFIPVSQEALEECHYKGGKDLLSIYCSLFPDTEVFEGKGLAMGGSHYISEVSNDQFYGDLSAILMQNLPWWAEFMRTPDLSIALMGEWEEKIHLMAEVTSRHNVTSLSGVPSWTLLLLRKVMEMNDVRDIHEVWPQLEVFFHGGVSFEPYREQFRQLSGGKMQFMETYNASEGFFGIQDRTEPG
ncbi:MAG TPA: GH3 auxin-responsive promoter family protein, partial [Bacteroidales bacterium]|nr:GH3 auxin-responsive promoter family protein [Bacteroidales bacterium]